MSETLQEGLAVGFLALLGATLLAGWRFPRLRPLAFALGIVAGSHAVYYVLFVYFPDVLDGAQTMLFSIVLRYEVLTLLALVLALAMMRGRWRL